MRFAFGIGVQFTKDGNIISTLLRRELIATTAKMAAEVFGGCFIQSGQGAWIDGSGQLVAEDGISVIADTPRGNRTDAAWAVCAAELAERLRVLWDQSAVQLTQFVAVGKLISV
jgi:hypothetical protein